MPNFSTPQKVLATIRDSDDAERARGENRVLINRAANNEPLLDDDEAEKIGMKIYNRWGERSDWKGYSVLVTCFAYKYGS